MYDERDAPSMIAFASVAREESAAVREPVGGAARVT